MATPPDDRDPRLPPGPSPAGQGPSWSDDDWAYADGPDEDPPPPRRGRTALRRLTLVLGAAALALVAIMVGPSLGLTLPRITIEFGPDASPGPGTGATAAPSAAASATPAGEATFVRPTPTAFPTFMAYAVKAGDSLGTIATTFRTTPRSIAWWNRGTYPSLDPESPAYNPGVIQVGWTLVLVPGVVVDDASPPSPSPGPTTPSPAASAGPSSPAPSPSR